MAHLSEITDDATRYSRLIDEVRTFLEDSKKVKHLKREYEEKWCSMKWHGIAFRKPSRKNPLLQQEFWDAEKAYFATFPKTVGEIDIELDEIDMTLPYVKSTLNSLYSQYRYDKDEAKVLSECVFELEDRKTHMTRARKHADGYLEAVD